jgi:integrin beta 1
VCPADEDKDENLCAFYDEDDCRFAYVYAWDETGKIVVRAQEQRECPPTPYILGTELNQKF